MCAYLYNGVKLPALPEWDKATYPYATILFIGEGTALSYLYFSSVPLAYKAYEMPLSGLDYGQLYATETEWAAIGYAYNWDDGFAWQAEELGEFTDAVQVANAVNGYTAWANYDLTNYDDGTVFQEASDPIPVTTAAPIDPTSFMQGWLVGRRIAAMRGKVSAEQAKTVTITWDGNTEGRVHSTGYYDCFYKVSDLVPTMDKFTDVQYKSLTTDGEVYGSGQLSNIVLMDNGVIWAGDFVARVVPAAGLSANIAGQECTFSEPGIYFCLWNGFYTAELTYTTTV